MQLNNGDIYIMELIKLNVTNVDGVQTMTSLELAKLCVGKDKYDHKNFVAKMKKVLGENSMVNFYHPNIVRGKETSCYNLPEREACLMAMSYSYELQAAVYDQWQELKNQQTSAVQLPDFNDPHAMALAWAAEYKDKQLALEEVAIKQQTIEDQKPAVEFTETVQSGQCNISMKDCAKALGLGRNTMMSILRDESVLMKCNTPYQSFIERGYFTVYQTTSKTGWSSFTTTVTGKGEVWLHKFLTKKGYL